MDSSQVSKNMPMPAVVWSRFDDEIFEGALVKFPEGTANRWEMIAGCLDGKTANDVAVHYDKLVYDVELIEAGLVELPNYKSGESSGSQAPPTGGKSQSKKGRAWTEEEHMLFLQGLEIYGKGDWRSISRHMVKTRVPSQVASHAQKYFQRQKSEKTTRKRSSIHDISIMDGGTASCNMAPPAAQINMNYYGNDTATSSGTVGGNCNDASATATATAGDFFGNNDTAAADITDLFHGCMSALEYLFDLGSPNTTNTNAMSVVSAPEPAYANASNPFGLETSNTTNTNAISANAAADCLQYVPAVTSNTMNTNAAYVSAPANANANANDDECLSDLTYPAMDFRSYLSRDGYNVYR